MNSMAITIGIIVFIWAVTYYTLKNKKQKIQEKKQRRLEAYQEQLNDLVNISNTHSETKIESQSKSIPLPNNTLKQEQKSTTDNQAIEAVQNKPKIQQASQEYREYLSQRYQKLGYTIWEHNKEQRGIDIIAKKEKELLVIESIYRDKKDKQKVSINDIKAFRIDVSDFIECNPLFGNYKIHLLFILTDEFLEDEAKVYIKKLQSQDRAIDYKIIAF